MADGYLKIKTKLDNRGIDKNVSELENKIKKIQTENNGLSNEEKSLQSEIEKYEELQIKADEYRNKLKELNVQKNEMFKNNSGLAVSVDTPEFSNIKSQIEDMRQKYANATVEIDKQAPKIDKIANKIERVKAKQSENNSKIQQFKSKIESIRADKLKRQIDGVGTGIQSSIKKIGRMALAVFGIRTAFNAVRSAISTVSQYNPQIASDIEYIRYALASSLLPVIKTIISFAYTLLGYINAITSAWFGINLFSGASAKKWKKMKDSASGTAKSAKEIKKSLQGFDEMNILQDNSNSGNSDAGVATPSMDLENMQGEVPSWLQWIIDNKDLILGLFAGITAGILGVKFGLGGLKSLGLGLITGGIVKTVSALIDYLNDPSWKNFGKIIEGVGIAVIGLGILIGNVPLGVAGAIVLIIGTIVKYWEQLKGIFQNGIDWLSGKSDWIHEMFGDTIGNIYDMFVNNLQQLLNFFDSVFKMIKGIFDGLIMFVKGVFTGDWKTAWEGVKKIFSSIWEGIKGIFFSVWNTINNTAATIGKTVGNIIASTFKAVVNAVLKTIENILNSPIKSINGLIGVINAVPGINLGKLSTFNLPRLAKGGVISQPTQAIIGEAGREAVVPLENNMEWLDILADKLASRIGNGGGSYVIQMDSRTIQRGLAKRKQELAFATNGRS